MKELVDGNWRLTTDLHSFSKKRFVLPSHTATGQHSRERVVNTDKLDLIKVKGREREKANKACFLVTDLPTQNITMSSGFHRYHMDPVTCWCGGAVVR